MDSKCILLTAPMNPLIIGYLGSPYGVFGWIKVFCLTEDIRNMVDYQPWCIYFNRKWYKIVLDSWKYKNDNFVIKIKNINDRNAASKLTNNKIIIDSMQLPVLTDGYYWKDLIGCQVINSAGDDMGEVINIIETGANDVLVVYHKTKFINNIKETLIPFLYDSVIKKVDLKKNTILVNWDPDF